MIHTFPKGICLQVNVMVPLEFELTNFNAGVQHLNHYAPQIF